ncbi:FecR family protein [Membranihabitans maritimus]|uniref:FecR family protein n=1 Tax=Membranihabitans maritimus TaxID=2904244 RepID=UPI001F2ABC46|nr:FecR family protein [Membranihabitans maritimus]
MDKKYTTEEILRDEEFLRWMKSDEGMGDNVWRIYASQSEEKFHQVQSAIDLYNTFYAEKEDFDLQRIEDQKGKLINGIKFQDRLRKVRNAGMIVSSIAVIVLGVWYWGGDNPPEEMIVEEYTSHEEKNIMNIVSNKEDGRVKPVELPDHSYVFLDPGSSVRFNASSFGEIRELDLEGSAFFIVEKQEGAQFIVNSEHFETTVLGTEFYVSDKMVDPESFVKVTEGRVSVKNKRGDTVEPASEMLTQMESIHLKKEDLSIYRKSEDLNLLMNSDQRMHTKSYKNESLDTVFTDLARQFKIVIKYDKEQLQDCTLTASFEGKKLDEALYIICRLMNASYLEDDGQIVIFSKGC